MVQQNVVIVGGGAMGARLARSLSSSLPPDYNLILITSRPFFTHLIGAVRTVVTADGNLDEKILMPYDKLFVNGNGKVIVGTVASITEQNEQGGYVTLADGKEVAYSVLVLSTGSTWDGPIDFPEKEGEVHGWITEWRSKFQHAQDVVIVGGGAVGIEFAGEIKDLSPSKKVTIVHGGKQLLNAAYPTKFREDVERRLRARGVELILGDIVPSPPPTSGVFRTRDGKRLQADLVILCRGPRPNTAFIAASLGDKVLTSSGFVKIDPTLQVESHPRIFAAGDIADLKEQKQTAKADGHVAVIVPNILSVLKGQKPVKEYKSPTEMIAITMGKNGGASYLGILWGVMLGDMLTAKLKSKELLVGAARKSLGL